MRGPYRLVMILSGGKFLPPIGILLLVHVTFFCVNYEY